MPKKDDRPSRPESGAGDLDARERLRRFMDASEREDGAEAAEGADEADETSSAASLTDVVGGGRDEPTTDENAPPAWPTEWRQPGLRRETEPLPQPAPADPPAWPEDWSQKPQEAGQPPAPPARSGQAATPADGTWKAPDKQAETPVAEDPPPWPEEWGRDAIRPVSPRRAQPQAPGIAEKPGPSSPAAPPPPEAPRREPREPAVEEPPEWPAEWAGRGPGTSPLPEVAKVTTGWRSADDDMPVPVEPAYWRALRRVLDPPLMAMGFRRLPDRSRLPMAPDALRRVKQEVRRRAAAVPGAPPAQAPISAEPGTEQTDTQDPPAWPEEWTKRSPGGRPSRPVPPQDAQSAPPQAPAPADAPARPTRAPVAPQPPTIHRPEPQEGAGQDPPEWPEEWTVRGPGRPLPSPAPPKERPAGAIEEAPPLTGEPVYWQTLRRICDPVLTAMGFRRLREHGRIDAVPDALKRPIDDDPEAPRRVARYLGVGAAMALVALLSLWIYAQATPGTPLPEAERARALMDQAVNHLITGELSKARGLRAELSSEARQSLSLAFFDGYLIAAEDGAGSPRVEDLAQRQWVRRHALRNLVTLAGYYEATDQVDKAVQNLRAAAVMDRRNLEVRLLLANLLLLTNRSEEAIEVANELSELAGPNLPASEVRGQAYIGLARGPEAIREFQAALLYDGSSVAARLGLADAYGLAGQPQKAAKVLSQLLRLTGDSPEVYARLGINAERQRKYDEAVGNYRKALDLAPDHPGSLNNLAYLLAVVRKRPAEALPYAERALKLAPNAPPVLDTAGWVNYLVGNYARAEELLTRANRLDQGSAELRYHLAMAYLANGKRKIGSELLTVVAERDTDPRYRKLARKELASMGVSVGAGQ